ncbi:MAG: class I SAM-dependent methyltransferase [Candidatus Eremiobacteraeota bacterium]|nr:class I SAM-dependent methyltransferase [Candidatus Eremiobacteraeota bacterium]MCW5869381.1 class I SAM-dependent methyltransferase [Candidatus Eremiobacteraeota bacterium]
MNFEDPEFLKLYDAGGAKLFIPGYAALHRMTVVRLAERVPEDARILVVGAGGGFELEAFARMKPEWRFFALDPSAGMLELARNRIESLAASHRVDWLQGTIPEIPRQNFDAATCLFTLHCLPDDGSKLEALRAIRASLKKGAPFALADNCIGPGRKQREKLLPRFRDYAVLSGAEPALAEAARQANFEQLKSTGITPRREKELLRQAGFRKWDLYYAGLSWRGWLSRA